MDLMDLPDVVKGNNYRKEKSPSVITE